MEGSSIIMKHLESITLPKDPSLSIKIEGIHSLIGFFSSVQFFHILRQQSILANQKEN